MLLLKVIAVNATFVLQHCCGSAWGEHMVREKELIPIYLLFFERRFWSLPVIYGKT